MEIISLYFFSGLAFVINLNKPLDDLLPNVFELPVNYFIHKSQAAIKWNKNHFLFLIYDKLTV